MIKSIIIGGYICHKIWWKRVNKQRVHGKLTFDNGELIIRKLTRVKKPREFKVFVFGKGGA
ncbi:hypothetical protein HPK19_07390 [Arthrobacter citreus]|nr:hypothetical protein HPK19_07390 [Arthrobacter citreus]